MTRVPQHLTKGLAALLLPLLMACGSEQIGSAPKVKRTEVKRNDVANGTERTASDKSERRRQREEEARAQRRKARAQRQKEARAQARARRQELREAERRRARARSTVLVSRVIDGDTIEVQRNGTTEDIRLIGIDTPETVHPTEPVGCYGPAASDFTKRSLEGKMVRLEFDVEHTDQYGRTLAYVFTDGDLFNETLVAEGYAQVSTYPPNVKYVDRFLASQRAARSGNRGLWGSCGPGTSAEGQTAPDGGEDGAGEDNGTGAGGCTPGYSPCLPTASDYDCASGTGDGPKYAEGPIQVTGSDPYDLDYEDDGIACE